MAMYTFYLNTLDHAQHNKLDMAKKKVKYCPLDKVPDGVVVPEKGYVHVARNLWVGPEGWVVRHWHEGEMHKEEYKSRASLLEEYPMFK